MLTRHKLRKIFNKHSKQLEAEFFRKNLLIEKQKNALNNSNAVDPSENEDEQFKEVEAVEMAPHTAELHMMSNLNFIIKKNQDAKDKDNEKDFNQENVRDYKKLDIFHRAIWPVMLIAQICSVMPIVGIYHSNPRRMRFVFKSLQFFLTITFLIASGLLMFAYAKNIMKIGPNAKNFVGVVFFGTVQFACLLFLSLAKRWPRVIQFWTRIEMIFTRPPYENLKRNLRTRIRFAACLILGLSFVEHILYISSSVLHYTFTMEICSSKRNSTASFENFIQTNYDYVFQILTYNRFVGVYILMVNFACTFIWNYMDLFIMMVSQGIAYRFEQISLRIKKIADKDLPEAVFVEIREHYVKVCELLDYVDENLSGIILLSCINNLYFVCYQLLNIFNKLRWPINYIYFWYSLLFLMGRTAFVFLTAASINDQSKAALGDLRSVPEKSWCIEVDRLIFQMSTQTVALSGKKFYFLTRRLLFGMAGTIVTYELVLLQFDEPNRNKGLPPLCG